ncbi:MAG: ATP-binding protein [Rhodanobacter sp.]
MKIRGVFRWRTAGLLAAVLAIVALPYFVTLSSSRDTQAAASWVTHSTEVKSVTFQLAYVLHDSEAAVYRQMVGDDNARIRVRAARAAAEVPPLLSRLRALTIDNPAQQILVGALESSANGRITLMNQARVRMQSGDTSAARQSLRDADDLFALNSHIAQLVHNEEQLLAKREMLASHQAFNGQAVLAVTALAQLLLLALIVVMSERQIGRRQIAESREQRAAQRAQLILRAVREPVGLFDENLNSLLVNNAFSELYGLSERDSSKSLVQIGDGAWSDATLQQRLSDVLLRDRELWDFDMIQRTVDGVDRHVMINARRLQQRDTDAAALLLTVSDITARALAEQEVHKLNRQLEGKVAQISDVNRELEAFSYSVSHDLRAPLRHIAGFSRKLEQHLGEGLDDKTVHYLDVISSSAQRMALLIDDLLVFSRLGRGVLRLQAIDLQSLVEQAKALAETEAQGRQIVWKIDPLPMVVGDENMLRTVWQNLLGNAVKYTGHCEIARIEVTVKQGERGDYEFTVADNGAGFDMQYAGKLFGVFQRLHHASDFPGNGIGLANVRRIVTRHGGRTWAEAEVGKGAQFHFSLPATDVAGAHN